MGPCVTSSTSAVAVVEAARASGSERVLLLSSGAVYGPQPPDLPELPETHPRWPRHHGGLLVLRRREADHRTAIPALRSSTAGSHACSPCSGRTRTLRQLRRAEHDQAGSRRRRHPADRRRQPGPQLLLRVRRDDRPAGAAARFASEATYNIGNRDGDCHHRTGGRHGGSRSSAAIPVTTGERSHSRSGRARPLSPAP